MGEGQRERGRHRIGSRLQAPGSRLQAPGSRLQAPGSRLRAISPEPDAGLELTDREIVT